MSPSIETEEVPWIISKLAADQRQKPWQWLIKDDEIVIIMVNGMKMRFPQPPKPATALPIARPETPAPVTQKLPIKRGGGK